MADWRVGRGWSEAALERKLAEVRGLERNFDPLETKSPGTGWRRHGSETVVAREGAGPPEADDAFSRAWEAVTRYEFSEPRIVVGHFDPGEPLERRRMLLELKVLGLHFLAPVMVGAVRRDHGPGETVHGYRYDTLRGHIECGWEWFLVTKAHATGEVRFRIEADWRPGDFPNAWSRVGFRFLGPHYQRRWTRRAHHRMRRILEVGRPVPRPQARLLHEGAEITQRRQEAP